MPSLRSQILILRAFQRDRLWQSYSDFASQAKYEPACHFFFDSIYGGENDPARDDAVRRLHKELTRILGGSVIEVMQEVIELQELSLELDEALAKAMQAAGGFEKLELAEYAQLYRISCKRPAREHQLQLLLKVLRGSHQLFQTFGIAPGLRALHAFQCMRGEAKATAFLIEGMAALRTLPQIDELVSCVEKRETELMNQWFAGS